MVNKVGNYTVPKYEGFLMYRKFEEIEVCMYNINGTKKFVGKFTT